MAFWRYSILALGLLLFLSISSYAQDKEVSEDIAAIVFLDSFVVSASQQGFVVADFIDIIQQDETFFQAFHNLRFLEHSLQTSFRFFTKKQRLRASCDNHAHQQVRDRCRTMEILYEDAQGDFFKNKVKRTHNYYTAKIHESVFFTEGEICEQRERPTISTANLSGIQKHVNELKKLIFQPGQAVQIPLIGNKTAIFEKDMLPYYQFHIQQDTVTYGRPCYTFTAAAHSTKRSGKTIIKYLKTWFDSDSFQVMGRQYHLKYSGVVRFDVKMQVDMQQIGELFFPKNIAYDGAWKIPLHRKEEGTFELSIEAKY